MEGVYITGQIAKFLGIAPRTATKVIDGWIKNGDVRAYRIPGRLAERRVVSKSFDAYMENNGIPKSERFCTTGEVAKYTEHCDRTVAKWYDQGFLKGHKIPGLKDRRFALEEVVRFMKEFGMPIPKELETKTDAGLEKAA